MNHNEIEVDCTNLAKYGAPPCTFNWNKITMVLTLLDDSNWQNKPAETMKRFHGTCFRFARRKKTRKFGGGYPQTIYIYIHICIPVILDLLDSSDTIALVESSNM